MPPIEETASLLAPLIKHHFQTDTEFSQSYRMSKHALIAVTSASVAWLYIPPSIAYAGGDVALAIQESIGTSIAAAGAIFNGFGQYMTMVEKRKQTLPMVRFLAHQPSARRQRIDNLIVFTGSFLSAIPITAAGLAYGTEGLSEPLIGLKLIVLQWANTALHFLPMEVIRTKPLFRLPIKPFISAYRLCQETQLNPAAKQKRRLQAQIDRDCDTLKQALISTLESARNMIYGEAIPADGKRLTYSIHFPEALKNLTDISAQALLFNLLQYAEPRSTKKPSCVNHVYNHYLHPITSRLAWLIGSSVVVLGGSGYYKNTYIQSDEMTHEEISAAFIASPTIFVLMVLAGYFGGKAVQGVYDKLVEMIQGKGQLPLPIKLYPKTAIAILMLFAYFVYYSTGTAEILIQDSFKDKQWDDIRPFLLACARYGMQIFGFINMFQIAMNLITAYAIKYGHSDENAAAAFNEKFNDLISSLSQVDGRLLKDELLSHTTTERTQLLRLNEPAFQQLLQHEENLQKYEATTWGNKTSSLWQHCRQTLFGPPSPETSSLVEQDYLSLNQRAMSRV